MTLQRRRTSFCAAAMLAGAVAAYGATITLDTATTLQDGSAFAPGVTYYAAFQFTGNGMTTNAATVSNFQLGSGSGVSQSPGDPTFGVFSVGPDSSSSNGLWQTSGKLTLTVDAADGYSLYAQQFTAGASFQFDVSLTNDLVAGVAPDAFAFQLYDSTLSTQLYEVDLNAGSTAIPEPGTVSLLGAGGVAVAAALLAKRRRQLT